MSSSYVVEITGNNTLERTSLGGKAHSLNHLVQAGLPVPPAFCVTAHAYEQFIGDAVPSEVMNSGDLEQIRSAILEANLPDAIRDAIVSAYEHLGSSSDVAVRSSALDEDGQSQSFAGQYETYLHINGQEAVLNKVQACWASLWAERAAGYRNADASQTAIAVVLQTMVAADCAGVLFTRDPISNREDRLVIDGCWGLGEGVVSGQVSTDTFTLDKVSGECVEKQLRHKSHYCVRQENGHIALVETPTEKRDSACLTAHHLEQLWTLAKQAETLYGCALDIEWAVKDDKVWLLQARPVTTTNQASGVVYANPWEASQSIKEGAFFSRMDTGEIVTGLMTPLGLSFCEFYQKHIHGPAVKTMGLADIGDWSIYMGYIQGQVYLNISGSAMLLRQCPPTRDQMKFTTRYATSDIDFTNYKNPYGEGVDGWAYTKSAWHWLKQQVHNMRTAGKTVENMISLRERETKRFLAMDLASLSLAELNTELKRIDGYFLESCAAYMPFFLQSFALYDALAETCQHYLPNEGNGLQNRIKASMNNLRTIEVTRGILDLVDVVAPNAELRSLFMATEADELVKILPEHPLGKVFWNNEFEAFLAEFGSRGRQEFELSLPRWRDDPTYLLQVMKMYLEHPVDLEAKLAQTEALRQADSDALLNAMPWLGRFKLKNIIKLYGVMAERRESTRPTFITETWFYRKIILEVLGRLENQGIVSKDDLPYIDFNQFRAYVAGEIAPQEAFSQKLLDANRHAHLLNVHAEEPPMCIIGGYTPKVKAAVAEGQNSFNGLAASPGKIVAKARVITDLQTQAKELKPGEILVAKYTDASWTPLFALAAGVITDIGSTLSHSCIVAREFGIPAVVNLHHATTAIESGDTLILDGDEGVVIIQRE
ncbi:prodigiosin ligase PigC [Pseudoalteromonas xiamenensis]